MADVLYHGSKEQNLKELHPFESGYNNKYVYGVSNEAFAAIFINRPGGSLVASWGRLSDGTPYFCERKKSIFRRNYSQQKGSIYIVNKKYFHRKKGLWKEEFISKSSVPVIKEIKIADLYKYFKKLEQAGKIKIIYYKNRLDFFPNTDKETIKIAKTLIRKYGSEKVLPSLKKHQPSTYNKIVRNKVE